MFVDKDRALWVGTQLGGLLRYQNDKFSAMPQDRQLRQETTRSPRCLTRTAAVGSGGALRLGWLNTSMGNGSIPRMSCQGQLCVRFQQDHAGNLWVGTQGAGLYELPHQQTQFRKAQGYPGENISVCMKTAKARCGLETRWV